MALQAFSLRRHPWPAPLCSSIKIESPHPRAGQPCLPAKPRRGQSPPCGDHTVHSGPESGAPATGSGPRPGRLPSPSTAPQSGGGHLCVHSPPLLIQMAGCVGGSVVLWEGAGGAHGRETPRRSAPSLRPPHTQQRRSSAHPHSPRARGGGNGIGHSGPPQDVHLRFK